MAIETISVMHANVNCSNLERSKKFYTELLGLQPLGHTAPEPQDGAGFGLPGAIQWDAYILCDSRGMAGTAVDLLEWKSPAPAGRPYAEANHLGFCRLRFRVPDVQLLHERLCAAGAACLSPPLEVPVDPRTDSVPKVFSCRDPDGTCLEFVEQPDMAPQLTHLNVNCSDLGRSVEWYQRVLGLEIGGHSRPGPLPGQAFGLEGEVEWEACFVHVKDQPTGLIVDLLEWKRPEPIGRPYAQANHLGIYRMAFMVEDAHACYGELRSLGVECRPPVWLDMGPEIPVDGLWAVFFPDPDGACLELIQTPTLEEPA